MREKELGDRARRVRNTKSPHIAKNKVIVMTCETSPAIMISTPRLEPLESLAVAAIPPPMA